MTSTPDLVARLRTDAAFLAKREKSSLHIISADVAEAADRIESLSTVERDLAEARRIIAACAAALGNGAFIDAAASLKFMAGLPDEITAVRAASQAEVARLTADGERMDWLVSRDVEVRTPLRYGSRADFVAQALSGEEDAEYRTDLREKIDGRRAALQQKEA